MIYKAVEVIWIFSVGGRDGWTGIEGTLRGPRGPKKAKLNCSRQSGRLFEQDHVGMTRGKAQKKQYLVHSITCVAKALHGHYIMCIVELHDYI